jgi:hypothetical protein
VKHVFYKPEQPLLHVYFSNGGMVSITTLLANGSMVEAATIGTKEWSASKRPHGVFLGEPALSPGETMMQVPDTNVEMLDIAAFRRELALCGPLSELLGRYTQAMIMLGVRRQTVAIVAGVLQEAGLIRYSHGHVRIIDRTGLENASCECYGVIRNRFDTLQI